MAVAPSRPRMLRGSRPLVVALLLVASAGAPSAWALCDPVHCTATDDPLAPACVVPSGTTCTAPQGLVQLGHRTLIVSGTLVALPGVATTISAGSILITESGFVDGRGAGDQGGAFLTFYATGTFEVRKPGEIVVSGDAGSGDFEVVADGPILMNGRIAAKGTSNDAYGGTVSLSSLGGDVTIGGNGIEATAGGDDADNDAAIDIWSDFGNVVIGAKLWASKGYCGTCAVDVYAGGDVTVLPAVGPLIQANSTTGDGDDGGAISFEAIGKVTLGARVEAKASGRDGFGGAGGGVSILAGTDASVTGPIDIVSVAGGEGGTFDVDAGGDIAIGANVAVTGNGAESFGGTVTLGNALVPPVSISVGANGTVSANGQADGGLIRAFASGPITISGKLQANGGTIGLPGSVQIGACDVTITNSGVIESLTGGFNLIQASGTLAIQGQAQVKAGAGGTNRFEYLSIFPAIAGTATISPAATIAVEPSLPCCVNCPPPTTTTTSTTSSTTTTTSTTSSTTSSTTTSTAPTTSTTSTSSTTTSTAPPVTTTTEPPATTTSTLDTTTTSTTPETTTTVPAPTSTTVTTQPTTTSTTTADTTSTTVEPTTTSTAASTTSTTATESTTTTVAVTTTTTLEPTTTTTSTEPSSTTTSSTATSTTTPTTSSTTTSSTSSTTTSAPSSTSTTTSTSATSTTSTAPSTTTTTVASTTTTEPTVATTSTSLAATTTTSTPPPTTTTLPEPTSCEDRALVGYDAVGCRFGLIEGVLGEQSQTALGGTRSAKRLRTLLGRARAAVASAQAGKRVGPSLRRAARTLKTFDRAVSSATKRGMPADVATRLRGLASGAASYVGALPRGR